MRPLLDTRYRCCSCCTLQVAASVIALYTSVAYIIAFFIEIWWIWETEGQVPYLGYILTIAYLVTFLLSAILVVGISSRRISHLAVWMSGVLAILLPEAGLALFMGLQFWRVSTLYGLTEVTCWACRLTVNIAGLICVQSLYSIWSEEKQVLSSLRDLNMASSVSVVGGRRPSVSSISSIKSSRHPPDPRPPSPALSINSPLRRWGSSVSLASHHSLPAVLPSRQSSEFDASLFDTKLRASLRGPPPRSVLQDKAPRVGTPNETLRKWRSTGYLPPARVRGHGRITTGYFTIQPNHRIGYIHNPNAPFFSYHRTPLLLPPGSKTSLAESDDTQKYRDVAL